MKSNQTKIDHLRVDYKKASLSILDVLPNPIQQFEKWFEEALKSEVLEPNAMVLSTVKPNGAPSSRVLLIKEIKAQGLVFYSNYNSNKGQEIAVNPMAAINFCWLPLERQVRLEGRLEKISEEDSTAYFQSRPKGSQIGAWVSPQSTIITDRTSLDVKKKELELKYAEVEVLPKPPHWGGYILIPERVEFWQGRPSRLHDRIVFNKEENEWKVNTLAP